MLYVIGVRPIGQEMLAGPWCNSNHRDWEKPCHSAGFLLNLKIEF